MVTNEQQVKDPEAPLGRSSSSTRFLLPGSLSVKLVVYLVAGLGIVFGLIGWQHTLLHRRDLEERTFASTDRISETIKRSARYSMLSNHRDEVYHIITTIGAQPGIGRIRIYNEQGRISFSTDEHEVGSFVDKKVEACVSCHAQEQPLARLNRPDRLRIFRNEKGERLAGLINPIENEPGCWSAPCHAHPANQQVLGVLDVMVPLASLDETIVHGARRMVGDTVIGISAVSLLAGVLTWFVVQKPVTRLVRGTRRVAAGDLEAKIPVESRDELGVLAQSFNQMTEDLRHARDEVDGWTRTLETRVEEKTAELKKVHQQMLHVERMTSIGKLAAIVAHEINNPLAGIHTYARLLMKQADRGALDSGSARENLSMIASESARCGEIVKGLLQFSRPNNRTEMRPGDVNEAVRHSLRLVEHKIRLMALKARVDLAPDLPPVLCDRQQVVQALVALLINACEATTPNEGELVVTTRALAGAGVRSGVEIRVRDNGSGMDAETKARIFEPFFTTKEGEKSLGVGLAVVLSIVTRHGGEIEVDSAPGAGTTFALRLFERPAAIPATATASAATTAAPPAKEPIS
ncbi:MAG TPA: ATP-binding protein [Thermoanaerobaculia bacterium]|nr:ATP-binding protein [Thermoanaerobaculia bacterium]